MRVPPVPSSPPTQDPLRGTFVVGRGTVQCSAEKRGLESLLSKNRVYWRLLDEQTGAQHGLRISMRQVE
jgi:hypothetical protein